MPHTVDKPLIETLHSGYIGQGPRVEEFESKLAQFLGTQQLLTLNSATSAITLALRLAGVEGGEVVTTPMTCMATNTPILDNRAIPVWADVDPNTGLIDPLDVERKITKNTRAIICVHWGGLPCDMARLLDLGDAYGIPVIEDAAHAWGARLEDGRYIGDGTTADFTAFSFQAIKHMTTGDGGLLVCRDGEKWKEGKLLRWYGIDRETDRKDMRCEEDVLDWGYKFHMNDINATIGIAQLDYVKGILGEHRNNALALHSLINWDIVKPAFPDEAIDRSSFWVFTVLHVNSEMRDTFIDYCADHRIQTSKVHVRNDIHTVFSRLEKKPLPGVTTFYSRMCAIPVHWKLSPEDRMTIIETVNNFQRERQFA